MRRPDNMRRGPVTLTGVTFQRTDGPVRGPAPLPVMRDRMIITGTPFGYAQRSEPMPAPKPPSDRVGIDEVHNSLKDEPETYTEPN